MQTECEKRGQTLWITRNFWIIFRQRTSSEGMKRANEISIPFHLCLVRQVGAARTSGGEKGSAGPFGWHSSPLIASKSLAKMVEQTFPIALRLVEDFFLSPFYPPEAGWGEEKKQTWRWCCLAKENFTPKSFVLCVCGRKIGLARVLVSLLWWIMLFSRCRDFLQEPRPDLAWIMGKLTRIFTPKSARRADETKHTKSLVRRVVEWLEEKSFIDFTFSPSITCRVSGKLAGRLVGGIRFQIAMGKLSVMKINLIIFRFFCLGLRSTSNTQLDLGSWWII